MKKTLTAIIVISGLLIGCATTGRHHVSYSDLKWEVKEYVGYRVRGESDIEQRNRIRAAHGLPTVQQDTLRFTNANLHVFASGWGGQSASPAILAELQAISARTSAVDNHIAELRSLAELVYAYLNNHN